MISIVGPGGFIGGHLVVSLLRQKQAVRCCFNRSPQRSSWPFEVREASVLDMSGLTRALSGTDTIINLSSISRELQSGGFETFYVSGTKNLVKAAQLVEAKRIIQLSALSTAVATREQSGYLYWKRISAEILLDSLVPATVIELSPVFGEGDQHLSFLAFLLRTFHFLPLPGNDVASVTTQPIWVGDVVSAIRGAISDASVIGATVPLAGPKKYVVRDLFRAVARVCGVRGAFEVTLSERTTAISFELLRRLFIYFPLSPAMLAAMRCGSETESRDGYRLLPAAPSEFADRSEYLQNIRWDLLAKWRERARRGFLWDAVEVRDRLNRPAD